MTKETESKEKDNEESQQIIKVRRSIPFVQNHTLYVSIEKDDVEAFRDTTMTIPYNTYWRYALITSIAIHMQFVIYNVYYSHGKRLLTAYLFDVFFGADWLLHFIFYFHPEKINVLYKPRPGLEMFLDFLTLLPLETINHFLELNRILRIYTIYHVFHGRSDRVGKYPVLKRSLEYLFSLMIISTLGAGLVFAYTCHYLTQTNCTTLLLNLKPTENFTATNYYRWYAKSQYLIIVELTHGGIPADFEETQWDQMVNLAFMILRMLIMTATLLPITIAAFYEIRRTDFRLAHIMPIITATARIYNRTELIPSIINFYRQLRTKRTIPEDWYDLHHLPASMQNEIAMHLHWDPISRSRLFKIQCNYTRRNIALLVKSWFLPAGYEIFRRGKESKRMIYVKRGTLCLETDSRMVYLGPGTTLGAVNLFYRCPSAFNVVCTTFCELEYIDRDSYQDFADAYPEMGQECVKAFKERIKDAKELIDMRVNKTIRKDSTLRILLLTSPIDWLEKRHREKMFEKTDKDIQRTHTIEKLLFSDKYLEDYQFVEKPHMTAFQNLLKPGSPFVRTHMIASTIVITAAALLLPYYSCHPKRLKTFFIPFAVIVILSYLADVLVSLVIIEKENSYETNLKRILRMRARDYMFYVDIIAILPVFVLFNPRITIHNLGMIYMILIHALKVLKLIRYAKEYNKYSTNIYNMFSWVYYLMIFAFPLVILTVIMYSLVCIGRQDCLTERILDNPPSRLIPLPINVLIQVTAYATAFSFRFMELPNIYSYIHGVICLIIFFGIFLYFYGDQSSKLAVFLAHKFEFKNFRNNVTRILDEYEVEEDLKARVMNCVKAMKYITNFQLQPYLHQQRQIFTENFGREMFTESIINILIEIPLFANTSDDFIKELANSVRIHILPPHETVVSVGQRSTHFFIIEEGMCESLQRSPQEKFLLAKYDMIGFVEVMGKYPMLSSVRTMTFCRVIAVNYFDFVKLLDKYDDVTSIIHETVRNVLNEETLKDIEDELKLMKKGAKNDFILNERSWSKIFYKVSLEQKTNLNAILKCLQMNYVIIPHGKFICYIEIARICFSVISAVLFPLRRLIGTYYFPLYPYLIMLLDLTAYADICLRFHYAYHDKNGILVTDPRRIAIRYLKRSFATDIIACFPFDFFFGMFITYEKLTIWQSLLYMNRLLQLYRIRDVKFLLEKLNLELNIIATALIVSLSALAVINIMASWIFIIDCSRENHNLECYSILSNIRMVSDFARPFYAYLVFVTFIEYMSGFVCCTISTFDFRLLYINGIVMLNILSVIKLAFYIVLTAIYQEVPVSLIKFKEEARMMVTFMNKGKVRDKTRKAMQFYYYSHWMRTRNIKIIPLFGTFHPSLCSSVLFELFGKTLRKCRVFHDLGDDSIRMVLPEARFRHFAKRWRVCRVNDVLEYVYILVKGKVVLESSANQVMGNMGVGCMFGNLEPTRWCRVALTVISDGNIEVMRIPTAIFYERLRIFPDFEVVMNTYASYYNYAIPPVVFEDVKTDLEGAAGDVGIQIEGTDTSIPEQTLLKWSEAIVRRCSCLRGLFLLPYLPKGWVHTTILAIEFIQTWVVYVIVILECGYATTIPTSTVIYLFDLIHVFLILYKFNCAFYKHYDTLVTNRRIIKDRYIRSQEFIFDIVSVVPIDIYFLAVGNLHLASWCRINRWIRQLNIFPRISKKRMEFHANYYFWRMSYFSLLMTAFLLIISQVGALLRPHGTRTQSFVDSMYYVVHFFAVSDQKCFGDLTISARLFFILAYHVALPLSFMALVWSCGIIRTLFLRYEIYVTKARTVVRHLKSRGLAKRLVDEVWMYMRFLWYEVEGVQEPELLEDAPHIMSQGVRNAIYGPHIRRHGFYRHLHRDFLRHLINEARHRVFFPGDAVALGGVVDRTTYFVMSGRVDELWDGGEDRGGGSGGWEQHKRRTIGEGEMFGLMQGIFIDSPHRYTYRARTKCHLLLLRYDNWGHLLDFFPATKNDIYHSANSMYIFDMQE